MGRIRILICGGRDYVDEGWNGAIATALRRCNPEQDVIVHGGAPGADTLADRLARRMGFTVEVYLADWGQHGKAAGPIRNQQMLDSGIDHVFAFPTEQSRGTQDMVRRAKEAGVPVTAAVSD